MRLKMCAYRMEPRTSQPSHIDFGTIVESCSTEPTMFLRDQKKKVRQNSTKKNHLLYLDLILSLSLSLSLSRLLGNYHPK